MLATYEALACCMLPGAKTFRHAAAVFGPMVPLVTHSLR